VIEGPQMPGRARWRDPKQAVTDGHYPGRWRTWQGFHRPRELRPIDGEGDLSLMVKLDGPGRIGKYVCQRLHGRIEVVRTHDGLLAQHDSVGRDGMECRKDCDLCNPGTSVGSEAVKQQ
jgi:hypothetical protein